MNNGYGSSLGHGGQRSVVPSTNFSFEIIRELGQGAYGRVCEVKQLSNEDLFAQKFVSAPNTNQDNGRRQEIRQGVMNDVATSKKLQHHHIASVLLWTEEPAGFNLIMPTVADCDLRAFLDSCIIDEFPKDRISLMDHWFGCLITALKFAHANRVKHDDLKPSNILIKDNRVYLADFGCATNFEDSQRSTSPEECVTGTPVYRPPDTGTPGRAGDVFALGCVFSEMLTVRQGRTLADYQAARKVDEVENPYAYRKNLPAVQSWLRSLPDTKKGLPNVLLEMILIMLKKDLDERESAKDLKARLNETLFCGSCV
jgi:serine/threonine protein kinase